MASPRKTLERILRGDSDASILFSAMKSLLSRLNFEQRVRGSHHIFFRSGIEEIINLQPKGSKCKPYQVKQVRQIIVKYKLAEEIHE